MHTDSTLVKFILYTVFVFGSINSACGRDQIRIVGSSSVYLFSTAVAEYFGKTTEFKTPVIEANGTGAGIKLFCSGVGPSYPDIVNASRQMTEAERQHCSYNGVSDLIEVKIGYDGIVMGMLVRNLPFSLSRMELYAALTKFFLTPEGNWQANPYQTWNHINPALPARKILILGPSTSLGTREVFEDLVIKQGCIDMNQDISFCKPVLREDGVFKEVGEHENVILQKLEINSDAIGIFSFGFLEQNRNKIQALPIEGILPSFSTIISGRYPISRPLFFYVKKAHISSIPGIMEYVKAFLSSQASGPYGYLTNKGLVPLKEAESKNQFGNLFN
ncbi:MAG: substrate-binding domain-containing protein [Alphaproteobacteria bacterium]|nr:substrate-binding domain-containing protein [Alphaproteobacteria bacterium]